MYFKISKWKTFLSKKKMKNNKKNRNPKIHLNMMEENKRKTLGL